MSRAGNKEAERPEAPGPGRPATFDREEAVEKAMHLLWLKGLPAVSASELADAMAIQRSSFYNSFKSRQAVFREALDRFAREAPDAPLDDLAPGDRATEVLVRVFRKVVAVRAADPLGRGCLVCSSVNALVGVDDELGSLLAEAIQKRIASLERLLRQAVSQEALPQSTDPKTRAVEIVAFLMGLNSLSKVVRDEETLWRSCRGFLAGLGIDDNTLQLGD